MTTTYYILGSTGDNPYQKIHKYTDPTGDSFEDVSILANPNNYKIDGLIYGYMELIPVLYIKLQQWMYHILILLI